MKFLTLLFLAGAALAAAVPLSSDRNDVEYPSHVEDFFLDLAFEADDDVKTELGKKLKEHLDEILEKIKEAIEHGKGVREDYLEKVKEIREKLKDLKVDIGNRARELLEKLKEKAKDFWQKILDKLKEKRSVEEFEAAFAEGDDIKTELGKKLKEKFDEILEKVKDAIENGKGVREDTLEKLKEIREKLKDLKVDLGNRARELIEKLKEKAKDYWKKILDKLNPEKRSVYRADDDVITRLRERFDELLQKIKSAFEEGKFVKLDVFQKLKEVYEQLKDKNAGIGDKAREIIENLKDKATGVWKRIMDRFNLEKRAAIDYDEFFADDDDIKTELGKKLKEHLDEILEKIKTAVEQGKGVKEDTLKKLKEIREKLRDLKVDIGNRARELLEQLKEKAKDYWQKILDKIAGKEKRSAAHAFGKIKEMFKQLKEAIKSRIDGDALKEKVEKLFGKGSELAEQLINMLKEKGEKGKNKVLEWIDRVLGENEEKRSIKEVYDKIRNYFRDLNIELKEKFAKFGEYVKEKYQNVLEKGKPRIENLKKIANKFVEDTKEISRDVAREALEFFREYKEDLGRVFDQVREKVKDILKKDN